MPLSAELDGVKVIAPLMTTEDWQRARTVTKTEEQRLLIGYSHLPGFARVSANGLKHFAHRPGYKPDYEWHETMEHLTIKAALIQHIAAAGWAVDTEVASGPDRAWIADVLAQQGQRRIAFEVQWSQQTAEKYVYRQERYAADDIECVWFARHNIDPFTLPEDLRLAFEKIPFLPLDNTGAFSNALAQTDGAPDNPAALLRVGMHTMRQHVDQGLQRYDLGTAVNAMLTNNLREQSTFDVLVYVANCTHCQKPFVMWQLDSPLATRDARPEENDSIQHYVRQLAPQLGAHIPLGKLEFHRTGTTPDGYKSFVCPNCQHTQASYLEHEQRTRATGLGRSLTISLPITAKSEWFVQRWDLPTTTGVVFDAPSA